MYPKLWGVIDTYPLCWLVGFVFVYLFLEWYFKRIKAKRALITTIELEALIAIAVGVVTGLLFQNLYDVIADPSHYHWSWDMTFYGGLIGGVGSFLLTDNLWVKKQYGPHISSVLVVAPSCIAVAHGWGRIGCFMNGCCYGIESNSPLAMKFQTTSVPVLPINLWEALFLFVLAIVLFLFAYFRHAKYTFPIYLFSYGIWRFGIEYLRGDDRGSFVPGLTPSQFWSILMILLGIGYVVFLFLQKKKEKETETKTE